MARPCTDRNMLVGIVALQRDFISRDALIDAMHEWAKNKARSLGQILLDRASLDHDTQLLVDTLVDREIEQLDAETDVASHDRVGGTGGRLAIWNSVVCRLDGSSCADLVFDERSQVSDAGPRARYRVLWPHARGGLGQIHVAEDTELHRQVALKEIQPKHADNPISRERFLFEAEITANLEHPGIVPVHGLGTYPDGRPFYTMRLIRGEELTTAIRRFHAAESLDFAGLEFRWLLQRFNDVCNTIAYAHSRGILHRDLKPGNIMLGPFGETLVMDWGVAKPMGQSEIGAGVAAETSPTEEPSDPAPVRESVGDAHRPGRGNASLHEPRAGRRQARRARARQRRLQSGGDALRLADGSAAVPGRGWGCAPGRARGAISRSTPGQSAGAPAIGLDLPPGDGGAAGPTISVGSGSGGGHRALAGG